MVYVAGHRKFVVQEDDRCGVPPGTYIDGIGPGWTNVADLTNRDGFNMVGYCCPGLDEHVRLAKEIPIPDDVTYARHYPPGYKIYIEDGIDEDSFLPIHKSKEFV